MRLSKLYPCLTFTAIGELTIAQIFAYLGVGRNRATVQLLPASEARVLSQRIKAEREAWPAQHMHRI